MAKILITPKANHNPQTTLCKQKARKCLIIEEKIIYRVFGLRRFRSARNLRFCEIGGPLDRHLTSTYGIQHVTVLRDWYRDMQTN